MCLTEVRSPGTAKGSCSVEFSRRSEEYVKKLEDAGVKVLASLP